MTGFVLVHAVVIASDRARADVHAFNRFSRVAQITEVIRLRTLAQLDLLGFDEVSPT